MGSRVYRSLLRLLPRAFRAELGEPMAVAAAERAGDVSGRAALFLFWLRECVGVVRVALVERLRARPGATTTERRAGRMDGVVRELRFAARRLVRTPVFTVAAGLTLALALGSVIAIWAVVKNVAIDPLPYPDSERIVVLEHGLPGVGAERGVNTSLGLYVLYRDGAKSLEAAAVVQPGQVTLTGEGEPEVIGSARGTPGLLRVMGVTPALGRWFDGAAGREGSAREAVLTDALWRTRFGADGAVLGRVVRLDGIAHEVIGVLPAGFAYPNDEVRVWTALAEAEADAGIGGFNYDGVARLAPGATVDGLRREQDALIGRLPETHAGGGFGRTLVEDARLNAQPRTLKERTVGGVLRTLWVLLAAVGLVLGLACANVANLFLVRSDGRRAEMALRLALGAGQRGVATQFLAESVLLALFGGAVGVGLAAGAVGVVRASGPERLPRIAEITLDPGVLAFAVVVTAVTGILLGLVPLFRRQPALAEAIHESGRRATAAGARIRARGALVAAQVALATVLLVACGLMVRSFVHLNALDTGFDAENRLAFRVSLPPSRYADAELAVATHERLLDRLRGLPGVVGAATVTCAPLEGWCYGDPLVVEGRPADRIPQVITMRQASPGYLETLGMTLRAGRWFDADDTAPVAVVNRALADLYFPGEDPLGRRVHPGVAAAPATWATIIGVVDNTPTVSLTETAPAGAIFFPVRFTDEDLALQPRSMTYVVHAAGAPLALVGAVRAALHELDPELALADVRTLEEAIADSYARVAFTLVLIGIAAVTALLLGAIGIYGVIAYAVARRTGEIGVRLALGARPGDVVSLIVRQASVAAGAGLLLGLLAAIAFGRFMDAILFGVDPTDAATFAATALTLAFLSFLATWLPARRAAALDPVSALRAD